MAAEKALGARFGGGVGTGTQGNKVFPSQEGVVFVETGGVAQTPPDL